MKKGIRNIILFAFLSSYILMIFSPTADYSVVDSNHHHNGKLYFTELSKLLFPQHINPDGYSLSIVCIEHNDLNEINHPHLVSEQLSFLQTKLINDYKVKTVDFTLKFPPEDIVYPFYDFW